MHSVDSKELRLELTNIKTYFTQNNERRRTLGNIRFIGELFKLSMLSETIMHNCILQLLSNAKINEDGGESLCILLKIVGEELDHKRGQVDLCCNILFIYFECLYS